MEIFVIETAGTEFYAIEKYLGCVSRARKSAVLKKKSEEDKVQSLVAALLVRSQLSKRLGTAPKKVQFEKGAHGKPYIIGGGVQFSVSHTNGAVCAAFTDDEVEIGVDIERKDRKVSEKLKERTLSKNELLLCLTSEDFICVWVQKEAFLKRTGIGLTTVIRGIDTTVIKDIKAFDCGGYFVGAAGKGAENAAVVSVPLSELLKEFDEE